MKKTLFSLILAITLLLGIVIPASAAPNKSKDNKPLPLATTNTSYPLHQGTGPIDWKDYLQGADFGINIGKGEDKFIPGFVEFGTEGTVFWHFVNPDKLGGYANIIFLDADGKEVAFKVISYKAGQHFAVITPPTWRLLCAEYFPGTAPGKNGTLFNLSHTAAKLGVLKLTVDVSKQHDEVTLQRYYKRDIQNFYIRDVWDIYKRDVKNFYSRDIQSFYRREYYDRYVPVFEKKVSNDKTSTLTSKLDGNIGGKFGNGMVWLEIDVVKAKSEGYTFGIAHSNPENTGIGYSYNVNINDGKLIVSFDNRFIGTKVTAKVYSTAPTKHDNSGHVTLGPGGKLSVDLPDGYGEKVYLYVHFADGISWYTTGDYEFVEWRYKDMINNDRVLVKTETGDYKLVKTENGKYKFFETANGDYVFIEKKTGGYYLEKTEEEERKTVTDIFDVNFDFVIKDASDTPVYTGEIKNGSYVTISNMVPGMYTVIISGIGIGEQTKFVNVVSGTAVINFNDIPTIIGTQVNNYLEDIKTDNLLKDSKTDNKLANVYKDNEPEKFFDDNILPDEILPDKKLSDVYLGSETDPYSDNAVRLN